MQEKPEFIKNFERPKNTEIKNINGHWYLYERSSKYDPKTKKMHKVSGKMLGTITADGFKPKKEKLEKSTLENVEVLELGASGYLWINNQKIVENLKEIFPDLWDKLFVISALRIINGPRFKRLEEAYETSALSKIIPNINLNKNEITAILRDLGKRRDKIKDFMYKSKDDLSSYMIFDGHRIISDSDNLENAAMGYDSRKRFKNQINLIYAFSVSGEKCFPYFYKQFSGDIPDITAFSSIIEESGIKKESITVLADKGFGSEDNFELLQESDLKYIILLKRTNLESKLNIPDSFDKYDECFSYHNRSILHKSVINEGQAVHIFMDTALFANEMSDFTQRLEKRNNTIELRKSAEEEFKLLQPVEFGDALNERKSIGTLTLKTNDLKLNGAQVYGLYKRRQAIEEFFKIYDDSLDFSSSYMRDNYTEEAWLFLNHLSSIMAFDIIDKLYYTDKLKSVSLQDFISTLSKIYADKISGKWYSAKMTKKKADFINAFDFDVSKVISLMNSADK